MTKERAFQQIHHLMTNLIGVESPNPKLERCEKIYYLNLARVELVLCINSSFDPSISRLLMKLILANQGLKCYSFSNSATSGFVF